MMLQTLSMLALALCLWPQATARPELLRSSRGTNAQQIQQDMAIDMSGTVNTSAIWADTVDRDAVQDDAAADDDNEIQTLDTDTTFGDDKEGPEDPGQMSIKTNKAADFVDLVVLLFQGRGGGRQLRNLGRQRCYRCPCRCPRCCHKPGNKTQHNKCRINRKSPPLDCGRTGV
eukprot:jgi/Ulvmu1/5717/UM024_0069.1